MVVNSAKDDVLRACSHKKMHAGLARDARIASNFKNVESWNWVEAHQQIPEPGSELFNQIS
eukprot:7119389-Lingulodinium_polyedra.AAC.1